MCRIEGLGSDLALQRGREKGCKVKIVWIYLFINQIPGEKGRQKKLGRNNNTKIDNPIFGVLQNFRSELIPFEVVKLESPYHTILGRSAYAKFMARPCYVYLN